MGLSKEVVRYRIKRLEEEKVIEQIDSENKEYFKGRPDSLLITDWEKNDRWEKLCSFLALPIPNLLFPHINKNKKQNKYQK